MPGAEHRCIDPVEKCLLLEGLRFKKEPETAGCFHEKVRPGLLQGKHLSDIVFPPASISTLLQQPLAAAN